MLIINQNEIEQAISPDEMVSAIEQAYHLLAHEKTHIPDRMHIDIGDDTLLLMPGFTEAVFGTKLVSVFPRNLELNKPAINGIVVLNNVKTGEPLALINGTKLTALRTAAISATAVKHLAPKQVQILGIIGAGVQAYYQAIIVSSQRDFKKLIICDYDLDKAKKLKADLESKHDQIQIEVTESSKDLVLASDVIITATSSNRPVFDLDVNQLNNKTFVCIGSYKPGMQEIPSHIVGRAAQIFVDTQHAKRESGDLKIPLDMGLIEERQIIGFEQLLNGNAQLEDTPFRLFKSVGMALFDLTFAERVYKNAINKGLGTEVEL